MIAFYLMLKGASMCVCKQSFLVVLIVRNVQTDFGMVYSESFFTFSFVSTSPTISHHLLNSKMHSLLSARPFVWIMELEPKCSRLTVLLFHTIVNCTERSLLHIGMIWWHQSCQTPKNLNCLFLLSSLLSSIRSKCTTGDHYYNADAWGSNGICPSSALSTMDQSSLTTTVQCALQPKLCHKLQTTKIN